MCAARWPGNLGPSSAFSSSLLFKHAAFGLRFRSANEEKGDKNTVSLVIPIASPIRTSDLLFECHYNFDSHIEDTEFRLRFVGLQVCHTHSSQFLEGLIDVPDAYPMAREIKFKCVESRFS